MKPGWRALNPVPGPTPGREDRQLWLLCPPGRPAPPVHRLAAGKHLILTRGRADRIFAREHQDIRLVTAVNAYSGPQILSLGTAAPSRTCSLATLLVRDQTTADPPPTVIASHRFYGSFHVKHPVLVLVFHYVFTVKHPMESANFLIILLRTLKHPSPLVIINSYALCSAPSVFVAPSAFRGVPWQELLPIVNQKGGVGKTDHLCQSHRRSVLKAVSGCDFDSGLHLWYGCG